MSSSSPRRPSGWYRDPENRRRERFWDGRTWTELRRDPPPRPPLRQRWESGAESRRRFARRAAALIAVLAILAVVGWWFTRSQEVAESGERGPAHTESADRTQIARVVGVADGDTIRVEVDGTTERLRIIGIDAPELRQGECYAQAAASRMQSLVQSRDVQIVADPTQANRDRYDRILRHVFTLDGVNVAETLIAEGLGVEYTYARAYAGQDLYRAAEESAREQQLGLWSGACDVPLPVPALTDGDA